MNSADSPVPNADPTSSPELPQAPPDKQTFLESELITRGSPSEGSAAPLMEVKVGVTLGGYRLVKKLGEGGMGFVFEAEDARLKRHVAMKVMKPDVAANENNRHRFIREAQAAALVEHDHIVPILTVGEENNVPFIVMPFLKGEPLDVRLKKGRLQVSEIIAIARQTAEGLAVAHEQGLIHRDIKPANIWLEESKSAALRVKILDFGLARVSGEERHLTQSGAIMGTPAYMAPEQARGREVDHRADLFSLGCVLYEMCTGKRPFTGPDTMSILTSLALDVPAEPHKLNPQLPPALSQLTMQLLEKDAAKRPGSASDMVEALKKLQPESTVVVIAQSQSAPEASPWAGIDASDTEMSPPPSVEGLSSTGSTAGEKPESPAGRAAPRTSKSKKRLLLIGGLAVLFALLGGGIFYIFTDKGGKEVVSVRKDPGPIAKGNPKLDSKTAPSEKPHYALVFDGSSAYADLPVPFAGAGDFTVEAWAVPERYIGYGSALDSAGGSIRMVEGDRDGKKIPNFAGHLSPNGESGIGWQNATAIEFGKPMHLALVRTGDKVQLYVNGRGEGGAMGWDGSKVGPPKDAKFPLQITSWRLGGAASGLFNMFPGRISEVRISKGARYDKDFTPKPRFEPDPDTLALYHMDEGAGEVLRDSSGNKRDGKIFGAKWVKVDEQPEKPPESKTPIAKAPGPWRPLLDRELSKWWVHEENQPAAIGVETGKELVLRLKKGSKPAYLWMKDPLQDHHWRMEFQFTGKEPDTLGIHWVQARFGFDLSSNGKVAAWLGKTVTANGGVLKGNALISTGALKLEKPTGKFPRFLADLKPAGAWNRLDLVRVGNSLALFVNGRFVVALMDMRWTIDGKETEFTGPITSGTLGSYGEVLLRRIEVRDISAFRPELIEPGPWQSLLDKDLTHFNQVAKNQPKAIWVDMMANEPVLRVQGEGRPYVVSQLLLQNSHLRLEFQTPTKGVSEFAVGYGWPGGKAGIHFHIPDSGKSRVWNHGMKTNAAVFEHGAVVTTGKPNPVNNGFNLADANLEPPGKWNRFELVRLDDRVAYFVNGRFLGAVAELRGMVDGNEFDLDKGSIQIHGAGDKGESLIRRVEVRNITAFLPELIEPGPWQPLLNAASWELHDNLKPDDVAFSQLEGEAVLHLRKSDSKARLASTQWFDNYHMTLEFKYPGKGPSRYGVGAMKGGGGIEFRPGSDGRTGAHPWTSWVASAGVIDRGAIVSIDDRSGNPRVFDANLKPAGAWNRLDLVRLDDSLACFINGNFVGALADIRPVKDGKETEFGCKTRIHLAATEGEALIRGIQVRDITALPPELLSPRPWEALLSTKDLSKWVKVDSGQADAFKFVESEIEPVLGFRKVPKEAYLYSRKILQSNHARMDFKFSGKEPSNLQFAYMSPSGKAGLFFHLSNVGNVWGVVYAPVQMVPGVLERGGIVPSGEQAIKKVTAALEPAGDWNRLDLVRVEDGVAIFINGRLVSAFAGIRRGLDGKEIEFGKTTLNLKCQSGELWLRRIEVRDISALPPELFAGPLSLDADRRAIDFALSRGIPVQINDQDRWINNRAQLPGEPAKLTAFDGQKHDDLDDAGLVNLQGCRNLRFFNVDRTKVGDNGLAALKDAKELRVLHLGFNQIGNAGVSHFKNCPELTDLGLAFTQVGDPGLANFGACNKLRVLFLPGTQVTNAGLEHFKNCTELVEVHIYNTTIGDAGLAHLKNCKNLEGLHMQDTHISDTSIESLKGFTKLAILRIERTNITAAGFDVLKKALPKCKIDWETR